MDAEVSGRRKDRVLNECMCIRAERFLKSNYSIYNLEFYVSHLRRTKINVHIGPLFKILKRS